MRSGIRLPAKAGYISKRRYETLSLNYDKTVIGMTHLTQVKIAEKCTLPVKIKEKRRCFGHSFENSPNSAFNVPIFQLARFLLTLVIG